MKDRGELPKEEGDVMGEYEAMHEEDFWSSWLREDEKSKEERKAEAEGGKEKRRKKRTKRGRSKEDVRVLVSVEAFEIFSQG